MKAQREDTKKRHKMESLHKKYFILICICFAVLASQSSFAGRPVYRELSLTDLVAQADIIAVVKKGAADQRRESDPCVPQKLPVQIIEIIKSPKGYGGARKGQNIEFVVNTTALRDCNYRKATPGSSGVSFGAERYRGIYPHELKGSEPFIVFVQYRSQPVEVFSLVVDGAFESLEKKRLILALLTP